MSNFWSGVLLEGLICGAIGGSLYFLLNGMTSISMLGIPLGAVYGGLSALFIGFIIKPTK